MTVLAYGAKQVRNLETTLGGKPPKDGAKRAAAELDRHVREQFKRRKANLAKVNRLLEKQRAPLLELLNLNKRATISVKEMREILPQLPAKRRKRFPREKIEPRMVTGSGFGSKLRLTTAQARAPRETRRRLQMTSARPTPCR